VTRRTTGRRAASAVRGLAALVTLLLLVVGLPAVLYRFGGSPVPRRIPSLHQVSAVLLHRDSGSLFLGVVRDVSWIAWALFSLAVLAETLAAIGGRQAPRLRLGGLQKTAGRLVALAAITFSNPATAVLAAAPAVPVAMAPAFSADAASAHYAGADYSGAHYAGAHYAGADYSGGRAAGDQATGDQSASPPAVPQVMSMASYQAVVVRPGECLWTIAQRYLGEGDLYPEIVKLNIGHAMGDGHVFSHPGMIWPGWVLQLPSTASPVQQQPPIQPAHHPSHPSRDPHFSHPHPAASHHPHPAASHPHPAASHPHPAASHHPHPAASHAGSLGNSADPAGYSPPAGRAAAAAPSSTQRDELPPIEVFAAGMLAGGVMASLARMRHRQRQSRRPGRRIPMPASAPVMQAEQRLHAIRPPQPATALRAALGTLGQGLAGSGQQLPDIAGIHLTGSAMELLLASPASEPPPPPFSVPGGRQGMAWHLALPTAAAPLAGSLPVESGDLLPGLLTAGVADGSGGYLLVDLEHLQVTTVDGPPRLVNRVLAAAAAELATSELAGWYDLIICGYSELEVAEGRATTCDNLDEALDLLAAKAVTLQRRLGDGGPVDVRYRRIAEPDDEDWALYLLVSRIPPTAAQLSFLIDITSEPGGIAAFVAGSPDGAPAPASLLLSSDPDRPGGIVAQISPLQLEVRPQALAEGGYDSIVSLFQTAAQSGDVAPDFPPYDGSSWIAAMSSPGWPAEPDGDPESGLDAGTLPRPFGDAGSGLDSGTLPRPFGDAGSGLDSGTLPRPFADPGSGLDSETMPGSFGDPVSGPFDDPVFAPLGDPLSEPLGDPLSEPFGDPLSEPLGGPASGPLRDPLSEPFGGPASGPLGDPLSGSPGDPPAVLNAALGSAHATDPGTGRPPGPAAARTPAGMLRIGILGSFTINGASGALLPAQSQLILALALNGTVGLSNPQLGYLLGADPDHPKPSDSLRQLIARTRRQLGRAPGGAEWVVHLGSGQYALHPEARFDWTDFSALAERGLAARDPADLREALTLVRGQPFTGCYHWWLDLAFVETVRAQIVDTAEMLAALELASGDPSASARAARAGLAGDIAAEQLWRALMRAEHVAGNLSGVREAWNHCLGAIADIAPAGEPHPDTAALYQELLRSATSSRTTSTA
jgi:DNA-binding SARP family transcriptional activator